MTNKEPTPLYPAIEPYKVSELAVSDLHTIVYEEVGNPDGRPALFLHGGPGVGISPDYRRFFDPEHYRLVLVDQRGAGRSTPHADIRENTTWDIVADIGQSIDGSLLSNRHPLKHKSIRSNHHLVTGLDVSANSCPRQNSIILTKTSMVADRTVNVNNRMIANARPNRYY